MRFHVLAAIAVLSACSRGDARPVGTVDSVVPRDTALARFREGLNRPAGLTGGAESLEGLVARLVTAVERSDTAGLAGLMLTRAEFAYLYYPTIPEGRPPYDLSPGLFWFMLEGSSQRGRSALLSDRGGQPLGYAGVRCDGPPRHYAENTVWPLCLVRRVQATGDTVEARLFGPIVERGGRFKLVTLANKL
jgi:hypothetical protein